MSMDNHNTDKIDNAGEVKRQDTSDTSPAVPDTELQDTKDMATLLEELRRVQEKLSDIDQRTKPIPDILRPSSMLLNDISEQQLVDSFLMKLKEQDPPSRLALDLQKNRGEYLMEITTKSEGLSSFQKYLQFERKKMEHKHINERQLAAAMQSQLVHRYMDLLWTKGTRNKDLTEGDTIQPKLNYVDWISFKACGEDSEGPSCVIDILVGEPILTDSSFSSGHTHRRKPTVIQDEQKIAGSKESTASGQTPLPERIRINSSALLILVNKIHGAEVRKQGGAVVMVRPFKALSFYQTQLRDWYIKLQKKFSPTIDNVESTSSEVGDSLSQESDIKVDDPPGSNAIEDSRHGSPKEKSKGDPDGDAPEKKEDDITTSSTAFTHLGCLLEFMDSTIVEKQKHLEEGCKKVSFIDLWHLFKPGMEVIEPGDKHMQCYRVVKVTTPKHRVIPRNYNPSPRDRANRGRGETTAFIHCVYIDFDGRLLGPVSKRFDISKFEGQKGVTSLPVYPLSLVKKKTTTRQTLIQRGQKFLEVIRTGHMHYSGLTLESRDEVDSQVVVDFAEALTERREDERNEDWKPNLQVRLGMTQKSSIGRGSIGRRREQALGRPPPFDSDDSEDEDEDLGEDCTAECCIKDDVHDDSYVNGKQNEEFFSDMLVDTDDENNPASLAVVARLLEHDKTDLITDEDKIIMPYRVFGFVLRSRSWAKLDLDGLLDLEEYRRKQENGNPTENAKENAFDNLVFPDDGLDRKTIVRSLVAQHFRDKESGTSREEQPDIVRGKGKGLIILLHGAPGVGKTTTAEGIAELFNKPLFQITCGDLGTTAKEVEAALETNFALANKWGSILLLDEADVFLARRNPQDFKRNGLVAVFLRVLEYYNGILFLTTNRIGDFDEAFSSRIHISLHYPALDYDSTIEIFELNWRLLKARFAHKNKALEVDETKITGFVTNYWHNQPNARWNGRQIRNACQTALALAEFEAQGNGEDSARDPDAKVCLGVKHMKTVTDAYLEFIKYLQDVRDADQERYAYIMGIRRREAKGMMPEDPLGYDPSGSFRGRGQPGRLAEHKAQFAARYNRPEQTSYQQNYGGAYQPERQGHRRDGSIGGAPGSPYQSYAQQYPPQGMQRVSPTNRPLEPQPQRGWNPGSVGGYYTEEQGGQQQQGPPQGSQESFHAGSQYGQHLQP